jgi:hypothetical protein
VAEWTEWLLCNPEIQVQIPAGALCKNGIRVTLLTT